MADRLVKLDRNAQLRERLDALLATSDSQKRLDADPLGVVRRFLDPDDREVVGLLAALLAFGNVVAIRKSIERVLAVLGPSPARRIDEGRLGPALQGFVHRVYRGPDVARLLENAAALRRAHGTIGRAFVAETKKSDFRGALAALSDALRGASPSRGMSHLVADPRAGSACKRTLLYLRWMVRPDDGVDLGLWPVSPSLLVIPVDTHVHRIALNLGLTKRKTASWKTAEEITARLRAFDPEDPVKYDFAICHLGVSRECPSRRVEALCAKCVLRSACIRWR